MSSYAPSLPAAPTLPSGVWLTPVGYAHLRGRIDDIQHNVLDRLRPYLMGPERDERDVAAFERGLAEVARIEGILASASPLPVPQSGRRACVCPGALVEVQRSDSSGEKFSVRLVHPVEATLDDERISWDSPLARVLLGAKVGDVLTVASPTGPWTCVVRRIRV